MSIQDIVIPILVIIFGGSGIISVIINVILRSKTEELREVEKNLREERKKIYDQILSPYIKLFSLIHNERNTDQVITEIKSEKYKKISFEFKLIGSDNVVNAYNKMIEYTQKSEIPTEKNRKDIIRLYGKLLLEIRKNLGNRKTKLNEIDMLRGMIKDIEKYLKI